MKNKEEKEAARAFMGGRLTYYQRPFTSFYTFDERLFDSVHFTKKNTKTGRETKYSAFLILTSSGPSIALLREK